MNERGDPVRKNDHAGEAPGIDVSGLRMRYGSTDVLDGVDVTGKVTVLGQDPARAGESWRARVGVVGYLTGQVVRVPLVVVMALLWLLVPGLLLSDGLTEAGSAGG